jgi:hypothetical protein
MSPPTGGLTMIKINRDTISLSARRNKNLYIISARRNFFPQNPYPLILTIPTPTTPIFPHTPILPKPKVTPKRVTQVLPYVFYIASKCCTGCSGTWIHSVFHLGLKKQGVTRGEIRNTSLMFRGIPLPYSLI